MSKERFEEKFTIEPNTGCWLWIKSTNKYGYGNFSYNNKTVKAHRFSYELYNDKIPSGMCVLHKCDVPQCVNPSHLFIGTFSDNNKDRHKKGRTKIPNKKGEECHKSRLTKDEILEIREKYSTGLYTNKSLAKEYKNVNPSLISRIVNNIYWKHI